MAKLIHAAFVTYLLSYALPAVVIAGDLAFGFQAAIMSFFGSYIGLGGTAEHLERGQTPACLLGALANVLMVGGYVCYNLRWFSKRIRPFCLVSSWLAGSAAVCALGAAVFLATGNETFIPSIGLFVWLASMIIMSFACWRLGKTVKCEPGTPPRDDLTTHAEGSGITEPGRSTDIPAKRPPKLPHWLIWTIPSLVLGLIVVLTGARFLHRQHIRGVDERIVSEVEYALISRLRGLSEDDDITQRYGRFIRLDNVNWDRPRYAWQLIVRLDWSATAHFEKAQARITLGIDRGETLAIERLEMHPSEEWRREHPELDGELVLIDGELWMMNEQGKVRCSIDGWARHPDFLYD